MQSTQITLHNIRRSPALSARIRELSERLETHNPNILNIRVAVSHEAAHPKNGGKYAVTVRVRLPGRELVASHESADDVYDAVRESFLGMRQQLLRAADEAREAAMATARKAATEAQR